MSSSAEVSARVGVPSIRWVTYGPGAVDELQRELVAAKDGDPLQRVTVVVPTKVSGLGLRRGLSSRPGGSVGVGYLVAAQLAEMLAAPRVATLGLRPLTPAVRTEVVRESLRREPGPLGHLATHPATIRALNEAFATIREATAVRGEAELLGALRDSGGLRATVADAYAVFRGLTAPTRYDEHDLALVAADAVAAEPQLLLREVGPVIVHLPTRATPATGRLLRALAEVTPVTVLLGTTGDDRADELAARIATELTGSPPEAQAPTDSRSGPARASIQAVVVPDAEEEVRQAARIVSEALHTGGDLSRIAILYRAREPYATLVHEILEAADLPHNGPTERRVRQTVAGRFLWDLWAWATDGHPRAELFDVLGSVTVIYDGGRVPAERWERIARKTRVLGGREHWDRRLEGFAAECQRQIDAGTPDWLRDRLERDRDLARELRSFVLGLADALEEPAELTWSGWSRWALALLDAYLGRSRRGWPEADIDAEGSLRQQLAALTGLDDLPEELGIAARTVTADDARAAVASLLDESAGRVGRAGTGVYVGPLGTAGTLDVDHAVVLGAVEGQFPPSPRDSVLIPDVTVATVQERAPAGSPLADAVRAILSANDQVTAARQALHRVVAGSRQVTMTVPRADRREQRAKVPGPWLLELLAHQHGDRVTVADLLEGTAEVTGVRTVASSVAGLRAAEVAAGVDELRLRLLSEEVSAGGDLAEDPIVQATPAVAAGIDITRRRRGTDFTAFDGHVTGAEEVLRERLERPHSPSALANYAECPRRYLFAQVLGIRPEDEPRRWLDVDALDRGNLVHDTLERWVAETLDGGPRAPEDAAPAGSPERLFEVYDERVAELEATGRTGIPALWAIEKTRIRRRLRTWLGQERDYRQQQGVAPVEVELPFGIGDTGEGPLAITTASGVTLTMRGKIDRIDASEDASKVVVTDYKTSRPGSYSGLSDDIAQAGTELQLPIYGRAAARLYPGAEITVGYWHVHDDARKEPHLVAFDDDARARTQQVLDTIAEGVTGGVFPAVPGAETLWPRPTFDHCKWCVFDRICPSHAERSRAAERDLASDAAQVLLPLWDPAAAGDDEAAGEPTP